MAELEAVMEQREALLAYAMTLEERNGQVHCCRCASARAPTSSRRWPAQ
jgi:hypothetical protein